MYRYWWIIIYNVSAQIFSKMLWQKVIYKDLTRHEIINKLMKKKILNVYFPIN